MDKHMLVYEHITEYMRTIRRERTGDLGELERRARLEKYPIADAETSDLIEIICYLKQPSKILEIGTCIGFSSLLMSSVCSDAEITTIERNPVMIRPAKENFTKFNAENITLMEGNALSILPTLKDKYDLIFLDAAKGQYPVFFKECIRLLNSKGILLADNVFFNGYVATGIPDIRRNKTIINRLRQFLSELENNESLKTVILPISDGVTLSYKTE